jgi:hypothetical protein
MGDVMLKATYAGHKSANQIGCWGTDHVFGVIEITHDCHDIPAVIQVYTDSSIPKFADGLDQRGEATAAMLNTLFRRLAGDEQEYTGPKCARCSKHPPEVELVERRLVSYHNWPTTGKSPERYYCSTKCFGEDQMAHEG